LIKNFSECQTFSDELDLVEDDRLDLTRDDPPPPPAECRCGGGGSFCGSRVNQVDEKGQLSYLYGADCDVNHLYLCTGGDARAKSKGRCAEDNCARTHVYGTDYCAYRSMLH